MQKNKGFALMGVLIVLSFVLISLSGLTMLQMSEIKHRGKLMKDLRLTVEEFNKKVEAARND